MLGTRTSRLRKCKWWCALLTAEKPALIDAGREDIGVFRTLIHAADACCYRNSFAYVM